MGAVSLKSILDIEQIDDLIFRGFTPQGGTGRVYGGTMLTLPVTEEVFQVVG